MTRIRKLGCVGATVWFTAGCGGSSSETPFPQPPIEPGLERRHDAVYEADHPGETPPANSANAGVSRAASSSLEPAAAQGAEPAAGAAAPTSPDAKTDSSK